MRRNFFTTFLRFAFLALLVQMLPVRCARAGQAAKANLALPKTAEKMRGLMGDGYHYLDKDELLIVSDLDKKTLYPLVSRDFLIYKHVLARDFYTRGNSGRSSQPILTIFLFKNRESYVAGLRKIGIDVAAEDVNNQGAVRDGYFYGGRERNFILINYRDNYEEGISTYAHELSHALMGKEFPGPPSWINEGMATMVGNSKIVNSHLRYNADSRSVRRMKTAVENGRMVPLSRLLQLTGQEYGQRENSLPFYDAGEQFCRFLNSRNQLLPIYRDLRDNGRNRGADAEIICRITGLGLGALEKAWHDWLRKQ